MTDITGLMKQAKEMQERMAAAQAEIEALEVTGSSGGGMATVTLSGKAEMRALKIDPGLIDPAEPAVLEDLVLAAYNDAKRKLDEAVQAKMQEAAGPLAGMLPPGFKPF